MRILAIDYGSKRVGVALTDESGSLAFPHGVFPRDRALIASLLELIQAKKVGVVVVGESKAPDGSDNPVMYGARELAGDLERETGLPVHFEPEFYSSYEARQLTDKKLVDAEAAAIILTSYLQRTKQYADHD